MDIKGTKSHYITQQLTTIWTYQDFEEIPPLKVAVTWDLSLVSWLPPSQKQRGLTLSLVVQFPKRPKSSQELDVDKSRHMSVFWLQYKRIVIPWHPTLSLALCDWCCDATESTLSKSLISKTTTIKESHRVFVFFRNLPTFVLQIGSGNKKGRY